MDNIFSNAAERDLMRAKMRVIVERALCNVEGSDLLYADRGNYEIQVRQEFAFLAVEFASVKP